MYTSSDILQLKPVYAYGQLILCMCIDTQDGAFSRQNEC